MKLNKMVFITMIIITLLFTFSLSIMAKPLFFEPAGYEDSYEIVYAYIETIESFRMTQTLSVAYVQSGFGHPLDVLEFNDFKMGN